MSRKNGRYNFTLKYYDAATCKDPWKFIREQEDNIARAQACIGAMAAQKQQDERANAWRSTKINMTLAAVLLFFVMIIYCICHWGLLGIIFCCLMGRLGLSILSCVSTGEKLDTSIYDNAIAKLDDYIEAQLREIDVARGDCRRQNGNRNWNGNYSQQNQAALLDECYRILGCSPNASEQELKRRYRELMLEFHPDHVRAAGNGRHLADLAEEQAKKINAAYDTIKRARGFK